jgi:superfamily II DNA or RNA helicase
MRYADDIGRSIDDATHSVVARHARGHDLGVPPPRPPSWEESLGALVAAGAGGRHGRASLAVELTLWAPTTLGRPTGSTSTELTARLLQRGRSGWIRGLSWSLLSTMQRTGEFRGDEVRLLRELFALHQCAHPVTSYAYGDTTTIDLAAFDSRQLWGLLDQAAALGLPLVHGRTENGVFGRYDEAELTLDVTHDDAIDGLRVRPVLRVEGADDEVVAVRFIGRDGHGVVYVTAAEARGGSSPLRWRPRLARMTRPVSPVLQRAAVDHRSLTVPATGRARFRDQFVPRLRHQATIVSSDGSFTPPTITGPTLVLRAGYGGEHEVALSWEWAYEIGDTRLRAPLCRPGLDDGYRDAVAERAVVDALALPLGRYGLRLDGSVPAPPIRLCGMDTVRFTTEVLPLLVGAPGVDVEVVGEPADYREAGDSLCIGLSTDEVPDQTDWFDLGVSITVEGQEVPFLAVFAALASDESHLLLPDGAFFSLQKPELQALRRLIEEARGLQDAPEGPLRLSRFQASLWDELAQVGVVERQATAWQQQVAGLLSLEGLDTADPPSALRGELRPYQCDGFAWLAFLWRSGLGGVLADDMGLGKTVQTLALICHAKQIDPSSGPFLIVAPTSVVPNWVAEAARFAPHLRVVAVTDTQRRRGHDLAEVVAGADVVVTSYTLFRLGIEAHEAETWSGLILDEAQVVKNHRSKAHQCARRLPAPFKLAITGTPMENTLMELWSLLAITAPGLFPSAKHFRDHYVLPIERQHDADCLARLRRRIRPLMKRRTKELVAADLPAKQEQVLEVDLDPRHRVIYQRHLQRERQKLLGLIHDMDGNRFLILKSLTLLRRLSLHAGFVDEQHDDVPSSKLDALAEQLHDVISGGHRALVFSQFTGYLARVRARLDALGIDYCYLDGRTRDREAVVREFKEGTAPVFLISLKAGGAGLNLAEADYCFLLDPWWNPATEAQAVDRAHRIGQTRTVIVYRLVAKDTIEQKVMALKQRKAELVAGVMDDGDAFGSSLDADDIRELLA